jgi:hypothetical protein
MHRLGRARFRDRAVDLSRLEIRPPDAVIVDGHHAALLIGPRHEIGAKAAEWLSALTSFEIELFCDGRLMDKGHALNVLEGPSRPSVT